MKRSNKLCVLSILLKKNYDVAVCVTTFSFVSRVCPVVWCPWSSGISFLIRFTLIEFNDFNVTFLNVQTKSYPSISFSFTEHFSFFVSPSNSKEHSWYFENWAQDSKGYCEIYILWRNTSSRFACLSCSLLSKSILKLQEFCDSLIWLLKSFIWNFIRQCLSPKHFLLTFSSEKSSRALIIMNFFF